MAFEWTAHRFPAEFWLWIWSTPWYARKTWRDGQIVLKTWRISAVLHLLRRGFEFAELGGTQFGTAHSTRVAQAALLDLREAINIWLRPQAEGRPDSAKAFETPVFRCRCLFPGGARGWRCFPRPCLCGFGDAVV